MFEYGKMCGVCGMIEYGNGGNCEIVYSWWLWNTVLVSSWLAVMVVAGVVILCSISRSIGDLGDSSFHYTCTAVESISIRSRMKALACC